ncbi:MAG: PilZ domain-containing protein [Myxococcales bacterium]|nr:PilZ domain-containing protein [Myxococcales bacterium]HRC57621.1 PilZ domain-containing protein [Kofleriaceae bacterium]
MALLDLVFRYRTLLGKCELAIGLSFDEIDEMCGLEAIFSPDERGRRQRRRYRRSPVAMSALLRGEEFNDHVKVTQLGAGGLECRGAPYVEEGTRVEIVFDIGAHSYRFSARAVSLRDDGADYRVGFVFEGIPVLVQGVAPGLRSSVLSSNKLMASIYQQLSAAA